MPDLQNIFVSHSKTINNSSMWFYFSRYLAAWNFSDGYTEKDSYKSRAGL